jgi:hypothetical protein
MSDKDLAKSVVTLGEAAQQAQVHLHVLHCTVLALLRTHPNKGDFAQEFRREWLLAGSQHSDESNGGENLAHMKALLSDVEQALQAPGAGDGVRLNVLPPQV